VEREGGRRGGSDDATKTHALSLFLVNLRRLSHDAFDVLIGSF